MKKIFISIAVATAFSFAHAQQSGKVTYEQKVKLDIVLDSADAAMLAMLPKEQTSKKELYFTSENSLFQNDKSGKKNNDIDQESEDGGHVVIKIDEADDKVFCDLKNKKQTEQRDFMTRKFLIESDMNNLKWKITGNQKKILNYACMEAVLQDTSKNIKAWFTSAVPVSTGPNGYFGLPGLILAIESDSGRVTITATNIDFKDFDKGVMVKPKEGKKVTKEEFKKIQEQKRKEMQEEYGGRGNMIIKINK